MSLGRAVLFLSAAAGLLLPLSASAQVPPPTCSLSVNPSSVELGHNAQLIWKSTNTASTTITPLGDVATTGSRTISPTTNTSYVGTFVGPSGTSTCYASVSIFQRAGISPQAPSPGVVTYGVYGTGGQSSGSQATTNGPADVPIPTLRPNTSQQSTGQGIAGVCTGIDCNLCSFGELIQKIINFAIGVSIPIAIVMFAWAGILFFTSGANKTNIAKARSIFKNVFIGFMIALSGWLIVQTVLSVLVKQDFYIGNHWNSLQCESTGARRIDTKVCDVFGTCPGGQTPSQGPASGIDTSGGSGTANPLFKSGNVTLKPGVSIARIQQQTIDAIDNVASDCGGCSVLITSGTEGTHVSNSLHYSGLAVDVQINDSLSNYIGTSFIPVDNVIDPSLPAYQDPSTGYIWSKESSNTPGSSGPHYHVSSNGH